MMMNRLFKKSLKPSFIVSPLFKNNINSRSIIPLTDSYYYSYSYSSLFITKRCWINIGKYNISTHWITVSLFPRMAIVFWSLGLLFSGCFILKKSIDTDGFVRLQTESNTGEGGDVNKETWSMFDHNNKLIHKEDLLGKYLLIYFGFTFCPDVCPIEMKKLSDLSKILEERGMLNEVIPIFVSVDYRRDSPKVIRKYLSEYSDKILGLCGTREQIEHFAKVMKTYFSRPPALEEDYILEHSVYMYFIDKFGNFKHLTNSEDGSQVLADKIALWIAEDQGTIATYIEKFKQFIR